MLILIYFQDGVVYLVPVNVKEKVSKQLVKEMCYSLGSITDNLLGLRKDINVPIIFILDCIYMDYLPCDDLLHGGWGNIKETSNLATLYSITKALDVSGDTPNSSFTDVFIENMRREIILEDLHR